MLATLALRTYTINLDQVLDRQLKNQRDPQRREPVYTGRAWLFLSPTAERRFTVCTACGAQVIRSKLKKHRESAACQIRQHGDELSQNGWLSVDLRGRDLKLALAGINSDRIVTVGSNVFVNECVVILFDSLWAARVDAKTARRLFRSFIHVPALQELADNWAVPRGFDGTMLRIIPEGAVLTMRRSPDLVAFILEKKKAGLITSMIDWVVDVRATLQDAMRAGEDVPARHYLASSATTAARLMGTMERSGTRSMVINRDIRERSALCRNELRKIVEIVRTIDKLQARR